MKTRNSKSLALTMGACLASSLAGYAIADARDNPFSLTPLASGYMVGQADDEGQKTGKEGKCGEGKCGGDKAANEAVCGIYKVGSAHQDSRKVKDGGCGGHAPAEMLCGDPR